MVLLLLLLLLHKKEVNIKELCDIKVKNVEHKNNLCSIPAESVWTKWQMVTMEEMSLEGLAGFPC
jgi:hypothetical protein